MAKSFSEADMGSMKGYDPNLGLPRNQVPNSGFTPKTGPLAPKRTPMAVPAKLGSRNAVRQLPPSAPKTTNLPLKGNIMGGPRLQGNANSTRMMAPLKMTAPARRPMGNTSTKGRKAAQRAFGKMVKGRAKKIAI